MNLLLSTALTGFTLTSSGDGADNPKEFASSPNRAEYWESTIKTNAWLQFDFPTAVPVTFLALILTNLTSAATWKIYASNTTGTVRSAPLWTSGAHQTFWLDPADDAARPSSYIYMGPGTSYSSWAIEITDAANPDAGLRVARAFLAEAFQPTHNMELGAGLGFSDTSTVTIADGGGAIFNDGVVMPNYSLRLPDISEDEFFNKVWPILQGGISKDICLVTDPNATTHKHKRLFWGYFPNAGKTARRFLSTRYKRSFTLQGL